MSRFQITNTPLADLRVITRHPLADERGFLTRLFCAEELAAAGWSQAVAQINHTGTSRCGTVRGLHYQLSPHCEMKLVSCIQGEIWDVALDLRAGSPTFLQWHAEVLSASNGRALLIPQGFAHGFQALSDAVQMIYAHSAAYASDTEAGLSALEPALGITWPLAVVGLSARDAGFAPLAADFTGLVW